jgi:hypothetical protein
MIKRFGRSELTNKVRARELLLSYDQETKEEKKKEIMNEI